MHILLFIILLPFTVLRFILLAITLWTIKYFKVLTIIPDTILWINDFILQLLSMGSIQALKEDSMLIDNAIRQASEKDTITENNDYTFKNIGSGAGKFYCLNCDYDENIVSFIHGFNEEDCKDSETGYQCQSCGKFHALTQCKINQKLLTCECGGNLERNKSLFCPRCKSKNITFETKYIT